MSCNCNNKCEVKVELCREGAVLPTYANEGDAGMDLYVVDDVIIAPGETKIIPVGIKIALPEGYEAQVRPRSGLSSSTKLRVANSPGTIDQNYVDEIGVIVENTSINYLQIAKGLGLVDTMNELSSVCNPVYPIDKKAQGFMKNANGSYAIKKGDRIAQLVITKVASAKLDVVDDVTDYALGNRGGGFGHTGVSK